MPNTNGLELLRRDHELLKELFENARKADDDELQDLVVVVCDELKSHAELEEEVFYPYLRAATQEDLLLEEAHIEHEAAQRLIEDLEGDSHDPVHARAVLDVLSAYMGHHIEVEEQRIFPIVQQLGVDLDALGLELEERRGNAQPQPVQAKSETQGNGALADTTAADDEFMEEFGDELSPSTKRAKWIHSVEEHADRPGQTLATRNHAVIKSWAKERGGVPATTRGGDPQRPRVLRLDFGDRSEGLQEISWDAWLRTFDERNLVFLFQERMKAGNQSNFFRLDSPSREEG